MKRTKPSAKSASRKHTSTQTDDFDSLIAFAKLEEQVRVLQLENNVLRHHVEASNKPDDVARHKAMNFTPRATTVSVEKSNCGCKGSCSSRICGCVKKNNKCNSSCKCDENICQNKKLENEENKENVNRIDTTPKRQIKKKGEERPKSNVGLFSPNVTEIDKNFEETQLSDVQFSFRESNTVIQNSQTNTQINSVELKKNRKQRREENNEQRDFIENVPFNPMKPRHQLSRTPPKKLQKSPEIENAIQSQSQPQPHSAESIEKVVMSTPEVKEEKIDWEEHTAQLISCKKCKRKFIPNRIQKHEACCKKI